MRSDIAPTYVDYSITLSPPPPPPPPLAARVTRDRFVSADPAGGRHYRAAHRTPRQHNTTQRHRARLRPQPGDGLRDPQRTLPRWAGSPVTLPIRHSPLVLHWSGWPGGLISPRPSHTPPARPHQVPRQTPATQRRCPSASATRSSSPPSSQDRDDQWSLSAGDRVPFAAPFGPAYAAHGSRLMSVVFGSSAAEWTVPPSRRGSSNTLRRPVTTGSA